MINYKSNTGKTVSIDRYQVTVNPGVELPEEDEVLEALVKAGQLTKNVETVEAPKVATGVPTKSGASK